MCVIIILTSHITKMGFKSRWLSGLLNGRLDGFALDNYCIQDLDSRFPCNHIGQGACIIKNQMFIPVGLGTEQHPSIIYVWNLQRKCLDNIQNFQSQVPHEFEDCDFYNHKLIMQTNGGGAVRFK